MGIITVERAKQLLWLGRYSERVYTTVRTFFVGFDRMIDEQEDSYITFCKRIDVPDVYGSKEIFLSKYPFDLTNPDSILSNLNRAYDNAIILRNEIGSETLAYIEMAIYDMKKAQISKAPLIEMQSVLDHLLAFWGCVDDYIDDPKIRDIIKTGRRIERIDLYLRFELSNSSILRELTKLSSRIKKTELQYDKEQLDQLLLHAQNDTINYRQAISKIEGIVEM
ncbi:MAG: alpha-E domain-containing protein [bacterium]|nr:alpha-E domain-containing protein [bacterium]